MNINVERSEIKTGIFFPVENTFKFKLVNKIYCFHFTPTIYRYSYIIYIRTNVRCPKIKVFRLKINSRNTSTPPLGTLSEPQAYAARGRQLKKHLRRGSKANAIRDGIHENCTTRDGKIMCRTGNDAVGPTTCYRDITRRRTFSRYVFGGLGVSGNFRHRKV